MGRPELATPLAQKLLLEEFSLSRWFIASLHVYHFASVIGFSSDSTLALLDTCTPGANRDDTVRMSMGGLLRDCLCR